MKYSLCCIPGYVDYGYRIWWKSNQPFSSDSGTNKRINRQTDKQTPKLKTTWIVLVLYEIDKKKQNGERITNVQTHPLYSFIYIYIYIYRYIYIYVCVCVCVWGGAKGDWDFRIFDLLKTLMELKFNPCGEFRWSPEGPASQIQLSSPPRWGPWDLFRSFKVFSDAKEKMGCGKQRVATAPVYP